MCHGERDSASFARLSAPLACQWWVPYDEDEQMGLEIIVVVDPMLVKIKIKRETPPSLALPSFMPYHRPD